ncbi:pH-response regulator [Auriscalpium vulgare]|uniref:PH-response regulator n=1 Tax=Auriscalpium vulgare TaxID=40419 RepID=A0ACB8S1J7_9AGAM|nr:pH-response regulator [Auriscalpium vulgare]
MPNQVSIPFKKTYAIPLKQAVYDHIQAKHHDAHPEAFKWDIGRWESLRKAATSGIVHVDRVNDFISYHAQLVFILTKLPADIALEIPYAPVFSPAALPVTLSNLHYERCAVLFNLAALYSQLGSSEDRSTSDGVKRASAHYQSAAGVLSYLGGSPLSKFQVSLVDETIPSDLSEPFVKSFEWLMLAQAQECAWQLAVLGQKSNGVIARLATQVALLYGSALSTLREASSSNRPTLPNDWLAFLETKQAHFDAAAQYRKGIDDTENSRYGHELARLGAARASAKGGYAIARRSGVATAVIQDIKSLLEIVESNVTRAQRDNDLIYHQDVPALSALPVVSPFPVAKSTIPAGIQEPARALGNDAMIFGELLSWGARLAIEIYNDRKQTVIKEDVIGLAQSLNDNRERTLHELNLPTALEALDKPIGLPPSLLSKAEEVRLDNGPDRIERSIEDVRLLARRTADILTDAMDILDEEASEDERHREGGLSQRLPSHQANEELTAKAERYRSILEQAAESDAVVRQRWDEWEKNIVELTWDEAALEASVPSSTSSGAQSGRSAAPSTLPHARALRVLLEQLDDLAREREQLSHRAQRLADADDIEPRIRREASGVERWADVQPSIFEDTLDEEIAKYDKFRNDIQQGGEKQGELLGMLKARMQTFLESRRDDRSVKERENALQSLDLAYHKYKEITRHLEEGLQFYNDLAALLMKFKENCKGWVNDRRSEMLSLTQTMNAMSMRPEESLAPTPSIATPNRPSISSAHQRNSEHVLQTPSARPTRKIAMDLPPPDSDQWQTIDLPTPPPSKPASRKRAVPQ